MQFEDLIDRGSFATTIIANLLVTFFAIEGYRRTGSRDRGLFLLAIAAALGLVCTFLNFTLSYTHPTPEARYFTWVFSTLLSAFDMALWAFAMFFIIREYTKQRRNEK